MPQDLFEEIDSQLDELYRRFRKVDTGLPEYIFHYTNAQGLIGILTENRLRASGADFLNDSSEPRYAFEILKASLSKIACSGNHGEVVAHVLNGFWEYVMNEYKEHGPHLYVFCLSQHHDLLSQWRGYGSQGAGYALGFSRSRLCELLQPHEGQYLVRVVYEKNAQMQEATDVLNEIISVVDNAINGSVEDSVLAKIRTRLRSAIFSEVVRLRAKFKVEGFHEENEWRLVQYVPSKDYRQVEFQAGIGTIKPYLELDIGRLPIERVTIGPTLDPDLSRQSLNLLLAKQDYAKVQVQNSIVPYRQ